MTVLRPQGYAIAVGADGKSTEWDTHTCAHCQKVIFVKKDPGGFCRRCMKPVCGPCADSGECKPFMKRIEEFERAAIRGRQLDALLRTGV